MRILKTFASEDSNPFSGLLSCMEDVSKHIYRGGNISKATTELFQQLQESIAKDQSAYEEEKKRKQEEEKKNQQQKQTRRSVSEPMSEEMRKYKGSWDRDKNKKVMYIGWDESGKLFSYFVADSGWFGDSPYHPSSTIAVDGVAKNGVSVAKEIFSSLFNGVADVVYGEETDMSKNYLPKFKAKQEQVDSAPAVAKFEKEHNVGLEPGEHIWEKNQ